MYYNLNMWVYNLIERKTILAKAVTYLLSNTLDILDNNYG